MFKQDLLLIFVTFIHNRLRCEYFTRKFEKSICRFGL